MPRMIADGASISTAAGSSRHLARRLVGTRRGLVAVTVAVVVGLVGVLMRVAGYRSVRTRVGHTRALAPTVAATPDTARVPASRLPDVHLPAPDDQPVPPTAAPDPVDQQPSDYVELDEALEVDEEHEINDELDDEIEVDDEIDDELAIGPDEFDDPDDDELDEHDDELDIDDDLERALAVEIDDDDPDDEPEEPDAPEALDDTAEIDQPEPFEDQPVDLDRIATDLDDVAQAMERIEAGTYWTDELTGAPIPDEVLAAFPTIRRAPVRHDPDRQPDGR